MKFLRKIAAPVAALALGASLLTAPVSDAQDRNLIVRDKDEVTEDSREWRQETWDDDRVFHIDVKSDAMERYIPLAVITPDGTFNEERPTLYMLNGAGGAEQDLDWITSAPIVDFYSDKDVNVVIPMEGAFSYYINWAEQSPNTGTGYLEGKQLWETFLLHELPGIIENHTNGHTNGKRGIAGYSMSATSSLLLAEKAPTGFFDVAGSFSGCAETASPLGYISAGMTVERAGAKTEQMFGPMGSPHNVANDALINAEGLRGTQLYISNASGLAGEWDMPGFYVDQGVDQQTASTGAGTLIVEGGVIEAATNVCTHNLKAKLDNLGIPADWNLRPTGTHSWNYWIDDLEKSWPTFERALY
ncbi:esterase family protein [Corynebacterium sp. YIM 101645]|uniref:Esterase family protein n=1 Tax=Corynebacterium lemuris TaxID=1859292 RepID=A0ABT2FT00_9CORY|nr:alpha/beta hydrolase family protein [Corynebacterium lemuris]MCS5478341.1 esterase family protein [Corynebacterium lemuris]